MSILIHGKMPTNGEVIVIRPNGQATLYARGDVAFIDDPIRVYKTVELPPHGRLGDLDALERNLREMADYQHGDRQQGILGCCNTICSAHTIIPAEGGTV